MKKMSDDAARLRSLLQSSGAGTFLAEDLVKIMDTIHRFAVDASFDGPTHYLKSWPEFEMMRVILDKVPQWQAQILFEMDGETWLASAQKTSKRWRVTRFESKYPC